MSRIMSITYSLIAYMVFLAAFLYAIGFTGAVLVPKGIDDGVVSSSWPIALAVDLALLTVFAVQHSVMARPGFKRWWTTFVPQPIERSTYVLLASAALLLLFWQWRPLTTPVWSIEAPLLSSVIIGLFWLGWLTVLASTFMISHFDLFGIKQAIAVWKSSKSENTAFITPMLYRYVRHPIYAGFLIAFWSAPVMSAGHLLFAVVTTAYVLVGIQLEERDLLAVFGERYRAYRDRVGMLVPRLQPFSKKAAQAVRPDEVNAAGRPASN